MVSLLWGSVVVFAQPPVFPTIDPHTPQGPGGPPVKVRQGAGPIVGHYQHVKSLCGCVAHPARGSQKGKSPAGAANPPKPRDDLAQ